MTPRTLPGAQKRALPTHIDPQLATLHQSPPPGPNWLHEINLDGYPSEDLSDFGWFFMLSRIVQQWLRTQAGRKTEVNVVVAPPRQMPSFWLNIWTVSRAQFQNRAAHFKSDIVCAVGDAYSPATFCLWDADSSGGPWPGPISGATAHEVAALYWQQEQWCVHRYFGFFDPRDPKDTVLTTELLDFFQTWPVIPSELLRLAAALECELLALCKLRGELPSKFETQRRSEQSTTPKAANPENEARDKFIYERAMAMVPWATIVIELRVRCKSDNWTEIGTPQGVRERAFNYAKRHQLAEPPPRQERST
jgi:hypothetical protein